MEKILRMKIYNTTYWKEHCFGLTSASVVEKAALLRYIGAPGRAAAGWGRAARLSCWRALPAPRAAAPGEDGCARLPTARVRAGGTYGGGRKPTEFMCLTLKLLQLQPDKEIVVEYIKNEDYKYVRLLGAPPAACGPRAPLPSCSLVHAPARWCRPATLTQLV